MKEEIPYGISTILGWSNHTNISEIAPFSFSILHFLKLLRIILIAGGMI